MGSNVTRSHGGTTADGGDGGAWRPDPTGRHELRWWDGAQCSDDVADDGHPALDAFTRADADAIATPDVGPVAAGPTASSAAADPAVEPAAPEPLVAAPAPGVRRPRQSTGGGDGRSKAPLLVAAAVAVVACAVVAFLVVGGGDGGGDGDGGPGSFTATITASNPYEVRRIEAEANTFVKVTVTTGGDARPAVAVIVDQAFIDDFGREVALSDIFGDEWDDVSDQFADREVGDLFDPARTVLAEMFGIDEAELGELAADGQRAFVVGDTFGSTTVALVPVAIASRLQVVVGVRGGDTSGTSDQRLDVGIEHETSSARDDAEFFRQFNERYEAVGRTASDSSSSSP